MWPKPSRVLPNRRAKKRPKPQGSVTSEKPRWPSGAVFYASIMNYHPRNFDKHFIRLDSDPYANRALADQLWAQAIQQDPPSLPLMLTACRYAAHQSTRSMAEALSERLPDERKISHVSIHKWEQGVNGRKPLVPSVTTFSPNDLVTAYGFILIRADHENPKNLTSQKGEWWTPEREATLRAGYAQALAGAKRANKTPPSTSGWQR